MSWSWSRWTYVEGAESVPWRIDRSKGAALLGEQDERDGRGGVDVKEMVSSRVRCVQFGQSWLALGCGAPEVEGGSNREGSVAAESGNERAKAGTAEGSF